MPVVSITLLPGYSKETETKMVGRVAMAVRSVIATPEAGMTVKASIQLRLRMRLACRLFSTTSFAPPKKTGRGCSRNEFGADQPTRAGFSQDHVRHLHYLGRFAQAMPMACVRCRPDRIWAHEVHCSGAIGPGTGHYCRRGNNCQCSSQCDEGSVFHACRFKELRATRCDARRKQSCRIRQCSSKRDICMRLSIASNLSAHAAVSEPDSRAVLCSTAS